MCKINMKMNFYYANICKHEHEKNLTRLWCKIVPKTNVEQIERNEGSYFYVYTPLQKYSRNLSIRLLCVH